ncbi:MAG: hypothetical protein WDN28_22110 [Chthoniobacter sp.]
MAVVETCNVAGQLFFKHAMGGLWERARGRAWLALGAGVAVMALSFFLWMGLLPQGALSQLYPFEALTRILLLAAAGLFFREKITPQLWGGVLLISAGIALVAVS